MNKQEESVEDYKFISNIDIPEIPVVKGEVPLRSGSIGKIGNVINNGLLNKFFK
ncbi:hypothetical protein [Paraliobacillus ryukyuensis]|uniref:hypothetical protein n=1 Tax=Paraliobacillus ryukyuensis TaxID=200904 RepID=UPI0015C4923C|nr:hypothetical protein [Paraliobacillus ryukyuensis]